jgi:hypothetical protein
MTEGTGRCPSVGFQPAEIKEAQTTRLLDSPQSCPGPAELDSFAREIGASSPREASLLLMRWEYPENGKMQGVGSRRVKDHL